MPALLFFSIYGNKVDFGSQIPLIAAGAVASLILFVGAELIAARTRMAATDKGVFVQGRVPRNTMIAGLAFHLPMHVWRRSVAVGAVYGGAMTLLYNVLAVITLNQNVSSSRRVQAGYFAKQTVDQSADRRHFARAGGRKAVALPVSPLLVQTGGYLSAVALPLALICAGATLNVQSLFSVSSIALWASIGRLIAAPLIAVLVGLAFGLGFEYGRAVHDDGHTGRRCELCQPKMGAMKSPPPISSASPPWAPCRSRQAVLRCCAQWVGCNVQTAHHRHSRPQSSGKSTLCAQLATHLNSVWVREYAREYVPARAGAYDEADLLAILNGQNSLIHAGILAAQQEWRVVL